MMSANTITALSSRHMGVLRISGSNARAHASGVRVCTVNVGTFVGKSGEILDMLYRRNVDICCLQEVQYKGTGSRMLRCGNANYKFWWSGEKKPGGVGILVKEDLFEDAIMMERVNDRIIKIQMVLGQKVCNIFSVYAPQAGRTEDEKEAFWGVLDDEVMKIPEAESLIIAGDLNGHVGSERENFEDIMGANGFGNRNREGERILDFCQSKELKIVNTMFKKDKEKLITYKSGRAKTQTDYILMKREEEMYARDCKAIPGESCLAQHRLLSMDLKVHSLKRKTQKMEIKRVKEWKLKDEETRRIFEERVQEKNNMNRGGWQQLNNNIMEAAREVCGETTGHRRVQRETWWWNEEIQELIKEKRRAYKRWQRSQLEEDWRDYKQKGRQVKREVAMKRSQLWRGWSENLNKGEKREKMFKIAKQMKKERKDITGARYIKSERGNIITQEREIMERWRCYFEGLLNEENEHLLEETEAVEGPVEEISREEVEDVLRDLKSKKAPGPTGVTSDMLKKAGIANEATRVFRDIVDKGEIPEEWKNSMTVPIFKGKGDALECGKYRGIRLLEQGMKLFEKILERRLRQVLEIDKRQFGFRSGKSTTDAIFIMRQLQEKFYEKRKKLYHVFVDLEKAFDRIPRAAIRWALRRQLVPERLVSVIMSLYTESRSQVRTPAGTSKPFDIGVGVHQGSPLSPLLFITVMEEATKAARGEGPWELLYADDLVLTAESEDEAVNMFNRWKGEMEKRGLKVNMEKTKTMVTGKGTNERVQSGRWPCACCGRGVGSNSVLCIECNRWCHKRCSGLRNLRGVRDFVCPTCVRGVVNDADNDADLPVNGGFLEKVQQFCYLGDVLDCEAGVERAVRARVALAWDRWREISGLLVNRSIDLESRGKIYEACVRSVLLYGSETWAMTNRLMDVLNSCDRRMLRYIAGVKWRDGWSSTRVASACGVEILSVRMRRGRMRWFGHVKRDEGLLNYVERMVVHGRRPVGRPKRRWRDSATEDMNAYGVDEAAALDRKVWGALIARPTPVVGR